MAEQAPPDYFEKPMLFLKIRVPELRNLFRSEERLVFGPSRNTNLLLSDWGVGKTGNNRKKGFTFLEICSVLDLASTKANLTYIHLTPLYRFTICYKEAV
jgi:hypothetical protein